MDEIYYALDDDPDFLNNISSMNTYVKLNYWKPHLNRGIDRWHDYLLISSGFIYQKGFIRFELNNNDPDLINEAIKEISNITMGLYKRNKNNGHHTETLYTISLILNITLLEEYGKTIDLIDAEKLLSQHTDEEMDNLIMHKNNNDCTINTKYIFNDKKGFYIDIPLLDEFYNFESIINGIDDKRNIVYKLKCHNVHNINYKSLSFKHFKRISLGYEKVSIIDKHSIPFIIDTFDRITTSPIHKKIIDKNNKKIILNSSYDSYNYKDVYIIVHKYNNVILLKPTNAIIYNFTDYDVYKINYEPDNTFIEFDNIENPFTVCIIYTRIY
jgi:hypothetical protein